MSGFLPANTTLQLSTTSGSINHQGVLTSNINGTPFVGETFPTTSTGTSTCHAHYTDASSNALKFLNASASGVGGHEFWVSTSSSAPIKTAQFDTSGLTIDKDTTITNYNTYPTTITTSTFIIMDYNPANAPTNWVLGQMYIMRVGNTTSTMSVGVDYNVKYIDSQAVRVYTTSSDTSPVIDSSGITSVLLPYSTSGSITTSVLSSTDLTFNSVSLQTTLTNLKITQSNLIYQFASPAIYADGRPMIATPTSIINTYAINAWYFINSFSSGVNKINWYISPDNGMVVSDVLGLYLRFLNLSTTSNDNTMFITVYTKLQASGNYASWYHSSMTYILSQSIQPTINTNYTMFMNASGSCPNPSYYASTLVSMQISPVAPNPRGTYDGADEILAFSIGTNSTSPINSVEFVLQKFGVMTPNGTQEFQFAPLL